MPFFARQKGGSLVPRHESDRLLQFKQILQIIKMATLALPVIGYFQYYKKTNEVTNFLSYSITMVIAMILLLGTYSLLAWLDVKLKPENKYKPWITPLVGLSASFLVIMGTGAHLSEYKFLFLLPIITTGMEHRRTISLSIALIAGFLTLGMDLVYAPSLGINYHFENDLVLVSLFVLVAWALSFYVELENNHVSNLNKLLISDSLTGIFNHRHFFERLESEVRKSSKEKKPLSLLYFNIDDFKLYNELFGHLAGDRVLVRIARILEETLPKTSIIARYGGDEFTVLLPDTPISIALEKAEAVRHQIQKYPFYGVENVPGKSITISAGAAVFPEKAQTALELLSQADNACTRAKLLRKNRVESYYSILEELQSGADDPAKELLTGIKTLIAVINAKDRYTFRHTERVVHLCSTIAKANNFSEEDRTSLIFAAYLHDVGKINVPESILMKPGRLDNDEWEIMKHHPTTAAEMVRHIDSLKSIVPIILQHHERYDGKGYPNEIKGVDINPLASLLTVIDSFDAMTSARPYQPGKSFEQAIDEIRRCSGTQFAPAAVQMFLKGVGDLVIH